MTGRELLEKLKTLPDDLLDLKAVLEGCDCYGDWNGMIERGSDGGDPILLLKRSV